MKIKPFYTHIDQKLVRGQYILSPLKIYRLKKQNINQIIDLRQNNPLIPNIEKFLCKIFGIKYNNFPYSFTDKNFVSKDFFLKINELISKNNGKSYIHCKLGKHRTGLCVAAYEKEVLKKSNREIIYDIYTKYFDDMKKHKANQIKAISNFAKMFDLR